MYCFFPLRCSCVPAGQYKSFEVEEIAPILLIKVNSFTFGIKDKAKLVFPDKLDMNSFLKYEVTFFTFFRANKRFVVHEFYGRFVEWNQITVTFVLQMKLTEILESVILKCNNFEEVENFWVFKYVVLWNNCGSSYLTVVPLLQNLIIITLPLKSLVFVFF